jgi:hypothetical protein
MTGHRPFNALTEDFSPERKARVASRVTQLKADMPLSENLAPLPTSRAARRKRASRVTGTNELPSRSK